MDEAEINRSIQSLINECIWHFDNADRYYDLQPEFERRENEIIRPIGEKLNDAGGIRLMRHVYEQVEASTIRSHGKHCRSALDMKWNGVGDWRS